MANVRPLRFALGLAACAFCSQTVFADEYPFTGFFTTSTMESKPENLQAICATKFFKQNSDGKSIDYLLDQDQFKKDGKVSYVILDKVNCTYYSKLKFDSCLMDYFDQDGTQSIPFFDYYERIPDSDGNYIVFNNNSDLYAFLRSPQKELPNNSYPTATKTYIHRCAGFSDELISTHLTEKHNALSYEETSALQNSELKKEDIPMILDVMGKIGKKALEATLPGQ